jgi:glyoxylase-like metal-dependent hydrolase (beta-lactamase superfamily II)
MEKLGANIYVETVYPGINVGCITTEEGAVCIDTPMLPGEAQRWRARIRSLGGERICFVVYTSGQSERVLGTQYLLNGEPVLPVDKPAPARPTRPTLRLLSPEPSTVVSPESSKSVRTAAVVAQRLAWEQVQEHSNDSFKQSMVDMLGERDPDMVNLRVILPHITFAERIELYAGDVTATLLAAAKGILWVWLPEQQVLFVGDTVVVGVHPMLGILNTREWLDLLDHLQQAPQFKEAMLVPGRGPLSDVSAAEPVIEYLHRALSETERVYEAGRPKADLNDVAMELVPLFPVADGQRERVQRMIKLGLDELYEEFKVANAASS